MKPEEIRIIGLKIQQVRNILQIFADEKKLINNIYKNEIMYASLIFHPQHIMG